MTDELLDPAKNPMIPVYPPEIDLEKVDLREGSGLAPFGKENPAPNQEEISNKISAAFPGQNEIDLNSNTKLVKMAEGTWTAVEKV